MWPGGVAANSPDQDVEAVLRLGKGATWIKSHQGPLGVTAAPLHLSMSVVRVEKAQKTGSEKQWAGCPLGEAASRD